MRTNEPDRLIVFLQFISLERIVANKKALLSPAAAFAAGLLLFVGGCTSKQPDPPTIASSVALDRIAAISAAADRTPAGLQPIPSGFMCRNADLYRKAPTLPGGWEKVTDGSAAKYCRLEEVCKLGQCEDRLSPADR